jgi:hypothetical protein
LIFYISRPYAPFATQNAPFPKPAPQALATSHAPETLKQVKNMLSRGCDNLKSFVFALAELPQPSNYLETRFRNAAIRPNSPKRDLRSFRYPKIIQKQGCGTSAALKLHRNLLSEFPEGNIIGES